MGRENIGEVNGLGQQEVIEKEHVLLFCFTFILCNLDIKRLENIFQLKNVFIQ
jgi:hypothetical protein